VKIFKNINGVSAVRAVVEVILSEIRINSKKLAFVYG